MNFFDPAIGQTASFAKMEFKKLFYVEKVAYSPLNIKFRKAMIHKTAGWALGGRCSASSEYHAHVKYLASLLRLVVRVLISKDAIP